MLTGHECVFLDWWTSEPQTETAPTSSSTSPSPTCGNGNLAQFHGKWFERVVNDRGLCAHWGCFAARFV